MDSKCLRLSTSQRNGFLLYLYYIKYSLGWKPSLYRIGAGCCSIIIVQALQSLQFDNKQQARVFFMFVHKLT